MEYNKRIYKPKQYFSFLEDAIYSFSDIKKSKKKNLVSYDFRERIMLAVTEVNGCPMCSYYHIKESMNANISKEEIKELLNGQENAIPTSQMKGILFAKYYADNKGVVEKDMWQKLVEEYGSEKAKAVLGFIRMIMVGNVSGIALGALGGRFKNKRVKNSQLKNELIIVIGTVLFIPIILIKNIFNKRNLF